MSNFKIVGSRDEASLEASWTSVNYQNLEIFVEYEGHQYQVIEKRERFFSFRESFGRMLLGIAAVAFTFFTALYFFPSVWNLFTKSKESVYLVLSDSSQQEEAEAPDLSKVGQIFSQSFKATAKIAVPISSNVKKTLDELFERPSLDDMLDGFSEKASYSIDEMKVYPKVINDLREIEEKYMEESVMKGASFLGPFIAFQLTCDLSAQPLKTIHKSQELESQLEKNGSLQRILVLGQWNEELKWHQFSGSALGDPHFFTWSFTDPKTGLLVKPQRRGFEKLKALLDKGEVEDLHGLTWRIKPYLPKSPLDISA